MKYNNFLRIRKDYLNPLYVDAILKEFSDLFNEDTISYIDFGKQDLRGIFSITIHYKESGGCSDLKYFQTSKVLISYIQGVLDFKNKYISGLKEVEKWILKINI